VPHRYSRTVGGPCAKDTLEIQDGGEGANAPNQIESRHTYGFYITAPPQSLGIQQPQTILLYSTNSKQEVGPSPRAPSVNISTCSKLPSWMRRPDRTVLRGLFNLVFNDNCRIVGLLEDGRDPVLAEFCLNAPSLYSRVLV